MSDFNKGLGYLDPTYKTPEQKRSEELNKFYKYVYLLNFDK